ncbi:TPA: hypothetical protein DEG21_00430 [Patescibacteria group bacterium]|nr:hypothetical protein [Candidatus Gracilibacteria bacterium]
MSGYIFGSSSSVLPLKKCKIQKNIDNIKKKRSTSFFLFSNPRVHKNIQIKYGTIHKLKEKSFVSIQ